MIAATPLADLSEKEWQQQVVQLARTLGFRSYHTLRSKGSQPGYPDLTLIRERVLWIEIKSESGKLSPAQRDWIRALRQANAEVYVARPRHLQALGKVLAARRPRIELQAEHELLGHLRDQLREAA